MGGAWRSEDLAGEAVLELDRLAVDDHLLRPGRRPVAGAAVGHVCGCTGEKEMHRDSREGKAPKGRLECQSPPHFTDFKMMMFVY